MKLQQKADSENAFIRTNNFGLIEEKLLYNGYEVIIAFKRLKSLIKINNLPFIVDFKISHNSDNEIQEGIEKFYKSLEKDNFDKNATVDEIKVYLKAYRELGWG